MIFFKLGTIAIAMSIASQAAFAVEHCNFAPKNNLKISANSKQAGGIDEATYNAVIDKVAAVFAPIVSSKGGTLQMNRMWSTDEVNSSADRKGKTWNINAYGGLARYKIMTADGEAMVLCHEMGHHLGGFPKMHGLFGSSWASNEGQADYFATMKCFRRVFENDDNIAAVSSITVPKQVKDDCTNTFKSAKEIALCERSSVTGQLLAQILYELGHGNGGTEPATAPSFDTPSTAVVTKTDDQHPLAQCRLDTYFNGSICGVSYAEDFGDKDGVTGACAQEKGDAFGYRPRCWYKPAN